MFMIERQDSRSMRRDDSIAAELLDAIEAEELSEDLLVSYFAANAALLKSNIVSAFREYDPTTLAERVKPFLPRYLEHRERIRANREEFDLVWGCVCERMTEAFGSDIPEMMLVPCIGLFSSNGWAVELEGTRHICVALDYPHEHLDILLTHEVAHGLCQEKRACVLDGFYSEGFATYVSSVLYPGHRDAVYLDMSDDLYARSLEWIDADREKIYSDASRELAVLNPVHKRYFTAGHNPDHPRVGYLIGFLYLRYLAGKYSLRQLRTFGADDEGKELQFGEFMLAGDLAGGTRKELGQG